MATLICKQCNYENEGERIYCHNCGSKLDRSVLPVEKSKPEESVEATRKRVKRLIKPDSGFFAGGGKKLVSAILWALLVAAVIEAVRPPQHVPTVLKKEDFLDVPQLSLALEDATRLPVSRAFSIAEDDINKYLAYTIKAHAGGIFSDMVKFDRSFVHLDKGVCWITSQQSLFGYALYATAGYQLAIENNKLAAKTVGGNIGRLPIHPLIMQYSDVLFQRLWDALTRERKLLDQMKSVDVDDGKITFTTRGSPPR